MTVKVDDAVAQLQADVRNLVECALKTDPDRACRWAALLERLKQPQTLQSLGAVTREVGSLMKRGATVGA